jgi:hypothetical protein
MNITKKKIRQSPTFSDIPFDIILYICRRCHIVVLNTKNSRLDFFLLGEGWK